MKIRTYFVAVVFFTLVISLVTIFYAFYLARETNDTREKRHQNELISRDISNISISILDPNVSLGDKHIDRIVGVLDNILSVATPGGDYALVRHLTEARRSAIALKGLKNKNVGNYLLSQLRLRLLEAQTAARIVVSEWNSKNLIAYNKLHYGIISISVLLFSIISITLSFIFYFVVKPLDIFSSKIRTHTPGATIAHNETSRATEIEDLYRSFQQMDGKLNDTFRILTESEKNLQRALADAEKANKEKEKTEISLRRAQRMEAVGQLTGGIAHDFNNLLNVMIGNSEILSDIVKDNEEAQRHIEAITRAVDRGASLTQRLLAFSRQQPLAEKYTEINDLVHGLEEMLRRTLGEAIELNLHLESNAGVSFIDPHQFENALVNLAINARDAMSNGGSLTIETTDVFLDKTYALQHEEITAGDYVRVAVSDTGTGITPEVLEKVFEPFFTTKDVGKGSGLGLSMVYGFVKQSNGHITIDSEVERGSTVVLYMPRSQEAAYREDTANQSLHCKPGSGCILVVEDNPDVREISASILRGHGYQIVEAEDGRQAVDCLESGQVFDLLFTDIVLPGGMSGVEIAKTALRIQPDIKVIYTSGYADNFINDMDKTNPNATIVKKPYRKKDLLNAVNRILHDDI